MSIPWCQSITSNGSSWLPMEWSTVSTLQPGEPPEAEFITDAEDVYAREFCNLHGLWKSS